MEFYARLAQWVLRYRIPVVAVLVLFTLISLGLATQLKFNFTPQVIFADKEDGRAAFSEEIKSQFAYEDTVLLLLLEANAEQDVLSPAALQWQYRLARRLEGTEDIVRVASVPTVGLPRENPDELGAIDASPLIKGPDVSDADADRARQALTRTRLIEGELISADRRVAVIALFLNPEKREIEDLNAIVERVKAVADEEPAPPGYALHYAGIPELRVYMIGALQRDQLRLIPFASIVMLAFVAWLFRRFSGVGPPLAAVGMGSAWLVTLLVLFDQSINIINNILFVLIGIIGTADAVHLVSRYGEEARRTPDDLNAAMVATVRHVGLACLLTSATTAVGFLSLVVAHTDVLQSFGWQAAAGVSLAYLAVLLLLPATMTWFKPPRVYDPEGNPGHIERATEALARRVIRWPRLTLALGLATMLLALGLARDVKVDSFILETFEPDHPQAQLTYLVEDKLGGFMPLEISLKADHKDAFRDPATYAKVAEFERFAAAQPGILHARSYVDFHQEMRVAFLGSEDERDTMPAPDARGRQQIYQIQEIIDSAGKDMGFREYMTPGFDHARVRLRIADVGTARVLVIGQTLEARLNELFPPGSGVTPTVTGEAYVASLGIDSFIRDLFYSLLMACVIIFGMMALLFRSLRTGLISIPPNIMPLVVTLGWLGVRGYDLNATNVILFSIGLGLAVDDTIHFLTRFREEIEIVHNVEEAIIRTFRGSGRAIVVTSLLLISGLLVLLISDFVPMRRFAELTSVTIFAALWGDLLVLPALIVLFWKRPAPGAHPEPAALHAQEHPV